MASNDLFRFETLLKLRQQKEDDAKRAVAARLNRIQELEERQEAIRDRIVHQTDEARDALRSFKIDTDQIRLGRHWISRMRQGLLQAQAEIRTQQAILASERSHLSEATTERKILARLKERRLEKQLAETRRREQLETDDLNVLRFVYTGRDEERL